MYEELESNAMNEAAEARYRSRLDWLMRMEGNATLSPEEQRDVAQEIEHLTSVLNARQYARNVASKNGGDADAIMRQYLKGDGGSSATITDGNGNTSELGTTEIPAWQVDGNYQDGLNDEMNVMLMNGYVPHYPSGEVPSDTDGLYDKFVAAGYGTDAGLLPWQIGNGFFGVAKDNLRGW